MPNVAKGEVRFSGGVWRTRVTLKGKLRHDVELPHALDEEQALERAAVLSEQARLLRKAGKAETMAARSLLTAMGAEAELGPEAFAVVARLCGATGDPLAARGGGMTFKQLGEKWTSDELSTDYPDSVPRKQSEHDKTRLEYLYKVDVGGVRLGDVALTRFTLEHGEAVKRNLPKTAKSRATRRHYLQVVRRVLELAVYPCRVIKVNPLPKQFLPRIGAQPVHSNLHTDELATLLAFDGKGDNGTVPLCFRVLWGFLAYEGCRLSEALQLRFGAGLDLERGSVTLDRSKTQRACYSWALDAGTVRALKRWKELRGAKDGQAVFVDEAGKEFTGNGRFAELVRAHLKAAGVKRAALFSSTETQGRFREHDLRTTFVTLNLAGLGPSATRQTEAWISERTGHKSSLMIQRYRSQASTEAQLKTKPLAPLDRAVPELRPALRGPSPTGSPMQGAGGRRNSARETTKSSMNQAGGPCRTRTGTFLRTRDFKSPASAIPPRGH
jgi:integrase